MADDLRPLRRKIGGAPYGIGGGDKRRHGVVVSPQQLRDADQRLLRPRVERRIAPRGGLTRNEGKDLSSQLVDAENTRGPIIAHGFKVPEQRVDGRSPRARGTPDGVPGAHDGGEVSAAKGYFTIA